MTVSVVQSTSHAGNPPASFGSNVTAGNTVLLVVAGYTTAAGNPTTSAVKLGGISVSGTVAFFNNGTTGGVLSPLSGSNAAYLAIWMMPFCPGGQSAVDVTVSGASGVIGQVIYEIAGLGSTPILDKSSSGGSATGTALSSGATGNLTTGPEFVLGASMAFAGVPATNSGWTCLQPAGGADLTAGYQIPLVGGSSFTWAQTTSGSPWAGAVISLYAAPVPAPFYPATQARPKLIIPFRAGRIASNPGGPVNNPGVVPVTGALPGAIRAALPASGRGRISLRPAPAVTPPAAAPQAGHPARATRTAPARRGRGTGSPGILTISAAVAGTTGTIIVTAPAGAVTAVTGSPGRIIRRALPAPRRGTGRGAQAGPVTQPGTVAGVTGQIVIAAPAGTVTAVVTATAAGRVSRPRPSAPRRGTGRGTFAVTAAPGIITGTTGQITIAAPAGTITTTSTGGASVAGPPGRLTLTAVIGTVTAVTGTPGKTVRSRTILPRPARRGHGQPGTAGATLHGPAGTVTVRAVPGTVTAVTGTTGKTVRGRTASPPRRGTSTRQHGTAGTAIAVPAGTITVTGIPGGIASTVNGTPGTVAVTGPGGHVVLTPYRYVRWDIRPGFAATGPRSHLIQGSPGMVTVKAPAGTVTIS